jgi:hypothetical protein
LSADGQKLYIMLITKAGFDKLTIGSSDTPLTTTLQLAGFAPKPTGRTWTFNGRSIDAFSTSTSTGDVGGKSVMVYDPSAFGVAEGAITNAAQTFTYTTPAHSATVIELDRLRTWRGSLNEH